MDKVSFIATGNSMDIEVTTDLGNIFDNLTSGKNSDDGKLEIKCILDLAKREKLGRVSALLLILFILTHMSNVYGTKFNYRNEIADLFEGLKKYERELKIEVISRDLNNAERLLAETRRECGENSGQYADAKISIDTLKNNLLICNSYFICKCLYYFQKNKSEFFLFKVLRFVFQRENLHVKNAKFCHDEASKISTGGGKKSSNDVLFATLDYLLSENTRYGPVALGKCSSLAELEYCNIWSRLWMCSELPGFEIMSRKLRGQIQENHEQHPKCLFVPCW